MEEYQVIAVIGGLILLTLFFSSVAEAYEQKQRENRIKILRIKRGLDEFSDLLERLKDCDIGNDIRDLLLNEIMARLQTIQGIDRHFKGIQALIAAANDGTKQESTPDKQSAAKIDDESELNKKLVTLRRLDKQLNSTRWFSVIKPDQLKNFSQDVKLLRCEKIFLFYSDQARSATEQENLLAAKEHYYYIIHALKYSGISSNPRIIEWQEQTEFMLNQISQKVASNLKKTVTERFADEGGTSSPEKENNSTAPPPTG